jgi:hypothetical protein
MLRAEERPSNGGFIAGIEHPAPWRSVREPAGRVSYLSTLHELVAPIIRRANQENRVIDYAQVADELKEDTGRVVSSRTLRRYGRAAGVRGMRTSARSAVERQSIAVE